LNIVIVSDPCAAKEGYSISDHYCNDELNIAECGWDGGYCCGAKNTWFCDKCECLDPNYEETGMYTQGHRST
jgi:hypothetical protein